MITVEFLNSLYNVLWYFGLTVMNTRSGPELQGHKPPTPFSDVRNNTALPHCTQNSKIKLPLHSNSSILHIMVKDAKSVSHTRNNPKIRSSICLMAIKNQKVKPQRFISMITSLSKIQQNIMSLMLSQYWIFYTDKKWFDIFQYLHHSYIPISN